MKPLPNLVLSVLLIALCGLCVWQWNRERSLRELLQSQRAQLQFVTVERDDLTSRVKAADAEVLRITASIADLRTNSVSKETHEEAVADTTKLRESVIKQNGAIAQQNELLDKQNKAIEKANENLTKLTVERDSLARRLNEVTAKFNDLAKKQ